LLGTPDAVWIDHLLGALDLQPLARRLPGQLSIGQRQRVAVARALAHRPALLLADEPTASLGADHGPATLDLLLDLSRSTGAAVVIVSHDIGLLRSRGVPLMPCHEADAAMVFESHD
jgi:putative ABC transport system ATP-binding protein